MENEVKIGDCVRYYSTQLGAILKGTVVEIKDNAVTVEMDKPIKCFTVDKYDQNWIERWPNGNS